MLDLVWDQMELLFGRVVSGTNAHKKRNKAVKDLKLLNASPEQIAYAFTQYQARFSCLCTDMALATHYPLLTAAQPQLPPRRYGRGVSAAEMFASIRREPDGNGSSSRVGNDPDRGLPAGDP
jgi:hypothetical protein